jgi:hypothetical protein
MLAPAPSSASTVLISGHVTGAATSVPIANADVNIWESFPDRIFNQHAYTDANGYYQMAVPSASIVHFIVSATGFTTQNQDIFSVDSGTLIQDFAMTGGGSIFGEIHAAIAGNPALANVTVSLLDANSKSTIAQTSSAADGSYSFQDIGPGTYGICVFDPTDIYIDSCYDAKDVAADGTVSVTPIDVVAGSSLSGIDVSLSIGAVMSGTLSDSYFGGPIADTPIEFTLYSPQGTPVAAVTQNTDRQLLPGSGRTLHRRQSEFRVYASPVWRRRMRLAVGPIAFVPIFDRNASCGSGWRSNRGGFRSVPGIYRQRQGNGCEHRRRHSQRDDQCLRQPIVIPVRRQRYRNDRRKR